MKRKTIVVRIAVDRRAAGVILAAVAVGALAMRLSSETLTMTTTYPAPVGVYNQIVTTGNSGSVPADTTLARNAGNVLLAPVTNPSGRVGVGVAVPAAKLDVGGTVRVGAFAADPADGGAGTIYYNSANKTLRVFTTAWGDLSGAPQGVFCGYVSTPGLGDPVNYKCQGTDIGSGACPAGFDPVSLGIGTTCLKK
ncbi:MAG: hypothetical protein KGJ84_06585 [Elusimicrobia bacterium]|nr:hypothetical protein [Elusimicrobiota bacterium]